MGKFDVVAGFVVESGSLAVVKVMVDDDDLNVMVLFSGWDSVESVQAVDWKFEREGRVATCKSKSKC